MHYCFAYHVFIIACVTQIVDIGLDVLIRKNLAQITDTQVVFEAARLWLTVV